jgi:FtsH-binding integral membrane protein
MKTLKIIVSLLLLSVVLLPVAVSAQPTTTGIDFDNLLTMVGEILWKIVGIVALIMFVIAGLAFMFAQGDPAKVAQARSFVLWGVVGIIVAILAYSIVAIVESFF